MRMNNNKYHAKKCVVGGEVFDSRKEAYRYQELCILEKAGAIKNLRRQVKYILIPSQREILMRNGFPKYGKVIERECSYVADFVYEDDGKTVVEDSKGFHTKDYIIKRKLMLFIHGIRIKEV